MALFCISVAYRRFIFGLLAGTIFPVGSAMAQISSDPKLIQMEMLGQGLGGAECHLNSPDHLHVAFVFHRGTNWNVVVDGQPGPMYDEVDVNSLVYSPDGKRLAYRARRGNTWIMVVNEKEQHPDLDLRIIGYPKFSPDSNRLAYLGVKDNQVHAVVNGISGSAFDSIDLSSMTFSPDSKHLAYDGGKNDESTIVLDGHDGPRYRLMSVPILARTDLI